MYVLALYNEMEPYEKTHPREKLPKLMLQKKERQQNRHQEILILETKLGDIRIVLKPDLSPCSIDYIHQLIEQKDCSKCNFYQAEDNQELLQGIMANDNVPVNRIKGNYPSSDIIAPAAETTDDCHGPILRLGSVVCADGSAGGPDFIINNYYGDAVELGLGGITQFTHFGYIEEDDQTSFDIFDEIILDMPQKQKVDNHNMDAEVLADVIPFKMRIEPKTDMTLSRR